jgi:hypothetical protein
MSEVTSVNGMTGTVVLTAADVEAVPTSAEGQPSGVATLNGSGVLEEAQLPSSVASGSVVGAGYNGLVWNGTSWEKAHTLTAPAGMAAQDLLIGGSSTAVSRVAIGVKGEQAVVRHDGTIGYVTVLPNAQAWGANPNAVSEAEITANTEALQNFCNFLVEKHCYGELPRGVYKINKELTFALTYGFGLIGGGRWATKLEQHAENTPILNIGNTTPPPENMHSTKFACIQFTYAKVQPVTNTRAIPILFSGVCYESVLDDLWFERCYYGIQVAEGIAGPWGCNWDNLVFGGEITGGAIDWRPAATVGIPNNQWGRFFVEATNMSGPIFAGLGGHNWTIGNIEIIEANQGPELMTLREGSEVVINSFKLEIGVYGEAFNGKSLITLNGSDAYFGILRFYSGETEGDKIVVNIPGGHLYAINNNWSFSGGRPSKLTIGLLDAGFSNVAGSIYLLDGAQEYSKGQSRIGTYYTQGCELFNNAGSGASEVTIVDDYLNNHIGANAGDANYTAALGSPNIVPFNTAFTAARTIELPKTPDNMFNGLYYEFIFDGAIKGTNYGKIVCNGVTLMTVEVDKTIVRFTWRRSTVSVQAGWVLTKYDTGLPI